MKNGTTTSQSSAVSIDSAIMEASVTNVDYLSDEKVAASSRIYRSTSKRKEENEEQQFYTSLSSDGGLSACRSTDNMSQISSHTWGWFDEDDHHNRVAAALGSSPKLRFSQDQHLQEERDESERNMGNNESVYDSIRKKKIKSSKHSSLLSHLFAVGSSCYFDNNHENPIGASSSMQNEYANSSAMAVTAPTYVFEESLSSQNLWKLSAGQRPPQPVEQRAFYEQMWAQNFVKSKVSYAMPVEILTAASPICVDPFADGKLELSTSNNHDCYDLYTTQQRNSSSDGSSDDQNPPQLSDPQNVVPSASNIPIESEKVSSGQEITWRHSNCHQQIVNKKTVKDTNDGKELLTVVLKGDNVFGTTVSKSFSRSTPHQVNGGIDSVSISIASYRVVESKKQRKHAQYLVIYREGSISDTVGVWKRYSDFSELSKKVIKDHDCASIIKSMSPLTVVHDRIDNDDQTNKYEDDIEYLPNAITSWRLLKKRQRWYRCLDGGYLSLKVFLLERFLHDVLFESSSPKLLRAFVGGPTKATATATKATSSSS